MKALKFRLRADECIWINGALIQTNRNTELSILNEASVILGRYCITEEQANTSAHWWLYYAIQEALKHPEAITMPTCAILSPDEQALHYSELLRKGEYIQCLKDIRADVLKLEREQAKQELVS